jgi:hypothetical protein
VYSLIFNNNERTFHVKCTCLYVSASHYFITYSRLSCNNFQHLQAWRISRFGIQPSRALHQNLEETFSAMPSHGGWNSRLERFEAWLERHRRNAGLQKACLHFHKVQGRLYLRIWSSMTIYVSHLQMPSNNMQALTDRVCSSLQLPSPFAYVVVCRSRCFVACFLLYGLYDPNVSLHRLKSEILRWYTT